MPNRRICVPPETTALLKQGAPAVAIPFPKDVIPCRIQQTCIFKEEEPCSGFVHHATANHNSICYEPPVEPGDAALFLETWGYDKYYGKQYYVYKADNPFYKPLYDKWRLPQHMQTRDMDTSPCRHVFPNVRVKAVQVKDIGLGQKYCLMAKRRIVTGKNYNDRGRDIIVETLFNETYPDLTPDSGVWVLMRGE